MNPSQKLPAEIFKAYDIRGIVDKSLTADVVRRIGHARWLRNVAVALGNALRVSDDPALRAALQARRADASELLAEHIDWALAA